jgi:hypothetical protein
MGAGLLILVSIGKENIYLSTEPEITYFKIAYKRYTNFSIETVEQYFKTVADFGRRVTVNISKNADLLTQVYVFISLPDIITSNHSILPVGIKQFAWVSKIGLAVIKTVDLEISGILIERNYGDWLNIWYELTIPLSKKQSYNNMIGNINILTNFSNGKNTRNLTIPLNFWFCQDSGIALPLVSMIHNDIKIHVEFNNFSSCFLTSPTNYVKIKEIFCLFKSGELIYQIINNNKITGSFVYYDVNTQFLFYNQINGVFIAPTNTNILYPIIGTITNFKCNLFINTTVIVDEPYFKYNDPSLLYASLLVNYIYLDNEERFNFINKPQQYLIPTIQNIPSQIFYSTNIIYKIPFINPNKIIFWRCCLLSNINSNNYFNYSLYPLTNTPDSIINNVSIILNSIQRMEPNCWEHYSILQNYLNNFTTPQKGIYMYSFSLNSLDYQPSGTCNFSQIDDTYLQITLNNKINYQNPIVIDSYGLQYNLFRIADGLGGLTYYL